MKILGVGLTMVMLLIACTESPSPTTLSGPLGPPVTTLDESSKNYLEAVNSIEQDLIGGFVEIGQALERVYDTREAVFTVVSSSGIQGVVNNTAARANALNPPEEYEFDHLEWLKFHQDLVMLMNDLDVALESRDLQAVTRVNTQSFQERAEMILNVSDSFCLAVNPEFPELCPPTEPLPGGEYGLAVNEIVRAQALRAAGMFEFPTDMTPEERAVRLEYVQPHIEDALRIAAEELARIDPPPTFSPDHNVLQTFFEAQYRTALQITAANADRDNALVLELFEQSNEVAAPLDDLSDQFRQLVPPLVAP